MEWHPYAKVFPLLSTDQLEALAADIQANGLNHSIVLDKHNRILDGRNRNAACQLAGVAPKYTTFEGTDAAALKFVISENIHRRHLDESQRAMIASEIANLPVGANQHTEEGAQICAPSDGVSVAEAAEALGVSPRSVTSARKVKSKGTEQLQAAVVEGAVSVSKAAQIAELPKEQQPAAIEEAKKPHVTNNSGNMEWYTPPQFIASVVKVMGGIDLDPASCEVANKVVGAKAFFTAEQDGLALKWSGRVWLNPPYSSGLIGKFSEAVTSKIESGEIKQACVLVNNATETEWCQGLLKAAEAVCFPSPRIKFLDHTGTPANSPLQGQVIVYFGTATTKFVKEFSKHGVCFVRCS